MNWTQKHAIELARLVEAQCQPAGCHVALTGGCLYKDGERKDCDLLFYRIRQKSHIDMKLLFETLGRLGIIVISGRGWVFKATLGDRHLDLFFPEEQGGTPEVGLVSINNNNVHTY